MTGPGRHQAAMAGWLLAATTALACGGDPPPAAVPVVQGVEPGGWSHPLRFAGDVVIEGVSTPELAEPGDTLTLGFTASGSVDGRVARIGAWPPRSGSRQVARGGVGAPPVEVPVDPRARFVDVPLTPGAHEVAVPLPAPWHSRQVLLTLELLDGDDRIPVQDGPRREDGVAMLAMVDVPARPTSVVAVRMASPPRLDGILDESGWTEARAHPMVHSLDGEPYDERPSTVRFAWDDRALYVGAQVEDPDVWSEYTQQDDPLWKQEVFEVFVFGDTERRTYLELQVSPRGVTFDSRFERYRKGDEAWDGQWQAAVDLRGTLDERRDRDEGWSVEIALPWAELCEHTEVSCPPAAGQTFVVNAFRFERAPKEAPVGLALSPPRVPDFHAPANAAVLELGGA